MQRIVLVGVIAPDTRRVLVARTLDPPVAHLPDRDIAQLEVILGLRMQLDENPPLAPVRREGEAAEAATRRGGHLGMDPVIGQVGRIAADSGLLGPLVDARTITLIGVALVADTHLQIAVCRHEAQTAERPLVDVAEAADRFERRLVTGLPAGILVVGRELDHTEGHPWSGSDHPPRMGRADARIDIVSQGLQGLRGPFDASGGHLATVAQHPVTTRPVASHGRHRHLEARAARLDAPAEKFAAIHLDTQHRRRIEPLDIDQQRLHTLAVAVQFIRSRRHIAHIQPFGLRRTHGRGSLERHTVEKDPRTLEDRYTHRIAALAQRAATQRHLEPAGCRTLEVPGQRKRIDGRLLLAVTAAGSSRVIGIIEPEPGILSVYAHLHQRREALGVVGQIDRQQAVAFGLSVEAKEDIDFMGAPSRRGPGPAPRVGRPGQHIGEIGRRIGVTDQIEFVFVAEVPGQKVPESVGRKGESGRTAIRLAHRPDRRIGRRSSPHGQGTAQGERRPHKALHLHRIAVFGS